MVDSSLSLPSTFVPGWSDLDSVKSIPYRPLGQTDMSVSLISYGTGHIAKNITMDNQGNLLNAENAIKAIQEAIRSGINLIDTSSYYGMGLSEIIVGQALKDVPRQAYFLSTKVGRHSDASFDYGSKAVKESVEKSLSKLNVDCIDLFHVHDIEFCLSIDLLLNETLPTLEQFKKQGKIRYIGITGYPLSTLKAVVEQSPVQIDVILSYCRHTLWDIELVNYLPFFKSRKIGVINAALYGMGLLGNESVPEWHPAPSTIRRACNKAKSICQENNVSLFDLALYHSLQESRIDTHLIGMETVEMVHKNLSIIKKYYDPVQQKLISNDKEIRILDTLLKDIFNDSTTKQTHWENVELDRFKQDPEGFVKFLRECWLSSGTKKQQ